MATATKTMKVTVDEKAKTLTIVMPLEKARESSSGKTMVVASTRGNKTTEAEIDGKPIVVGINAYYYKD